MIPKPRDVQALAKVAETGGREAAHLVDEALKLIDDGARGSAATARTANHSLIPVRELIRGGDDIGDSMPALENLPEIGSFMPTSFRVMPGSKFPGAHFRYPKGEPRYEGPYTSFDDSIVAQARRVGLYRGSTTAYESASGPVFTIWDDMPRAVEKGAAFQPFKVGEKTQPMGPELRKLVDEYRAIQDQLASPPEGYSAITLNNKVIPKWIDEEVAHYGNSGLTMLARKVPRTQSEWYETPSGRVFNADGWYLLTQKQLADGRIRFPKFAF